MKKTHKKVLGFAGLGLVAAVTTVAAVMPTPTATAVSTYTDVIQLRIENAAPLLEASSSSPSEISDNSYGFHVEYDNLSGARAVLVNTDDSGAVLYDGEIWNEVLNYAAGSKDFTLNLDNYGGRGNITITIRGEGEGGVPIERILTVKYAEPIQDVTPDDDGNADVDVDVPDEKVASRIANVYDDTGTLVKTIIVNNPADPEQFDLHELGDGNYDLEVISKNANGEVIDTLRRPIILDQYTGGAKAESIIEDVGQTIDHVIVKVKDSSGAVIDQVTINNPSVGDKVYVDLQNGLPKGDYTVSTEYYNPSGELIGTKDSISTKSDTNGIVELGIATRIDTITNAETKIYDEDGNLVRIVRTDRESGVAEVYDKDDNLIFTISNAWKGTDDIVIPMSGLKSGTYIGVITFKNKYGSPVGNVKRVRIHWGGDKEIIVPDTGGFFQGLNISREDYLITGLVVFMVIGVVAFGIVKRNKSSKKHRR